MTKEKEKPKFRLLKFPKQDLIMNRIESLEQSLIGHNDLLYYCDELLCLVENQMLTMDPNLSHELNMAMDRLAESRHWLGEFLTSFEMEVEKRKNEKK